MTLVFHPTVKCFSFLRRCVPPFVRADGPNSWFVFSMRPRPLWRFFLLCFAVRGFGGSCLMSRDPRPLEACRAPQISPPFAPCHECLIKSSYLVVLQVQEAILRVIWVSIISPLVFFVIWLFLDCLINCFPVSCGFSSSFCPILPFSFSLYFSNCIC